MGGAKYSMINCGALGLVTGRMATTSGCFSLPVEGLNVVGDELPCFSSL
jgi:hypothetical protein